jgi:ubiquinone/menaquinone biosynthesis C-methylase UbiE
MAAPFTLNPRAASGFQNAASYDAHRPTFPKEAVDKLLTHLGVDNVKNARLIDLGCGTGKFTEALADREEEFEVVGIEPHEGMREELVKKKLSRVKVQEGDAAHMPIEDGWGDALIAAQVSCQSFCQCIVRWRLLSRVSVGFSLVCLLDYAIELRLLTWRRFATEESLKEIHRVLRPGAAFGVIWNIEDCAFELYWLGTQGH